MASSDVVSIKVLLDIIETSKSFDELKSNLVRTLQTMQAAAQRTDIAPKGIDKAINQAKKLEKEFDRLGVEVDRDLKKIGTSFDTLDKEIVQTGQKMDRQFRANAKAALDELRENLARAVERLRALRMEPGFDPMSEKARKATGYPIRLPTFVASTRQWRPWRPLLRRLRSVCRVWRLSSTV
jgi:ABC-type phosphate transport system auxiliary subunit